MKEQIQEYARNLLAEGKIAGFLALLEDGEHIRPHLFTGPDDLDRLSLGDKERPGEARYPLVKILTRIQSQYPKETFAVMVRGCEERAVQKLAQASQLDRKRVVLAGFSCPAELAEKHGCLKPYPEALVAGAKPDRPRGPKVITATTRNLVKDLDFINEISQRCVKCYGCRNVCPVCFCKECTLEEETFVPRGSLPPANDFLLTRAIHMVDYCIYCGLCEEACPADIPLTTMYKMVANIINDRQGYFIQALPKQPAAEPRQAAV